MNRATPFPWATDGAETGAQFPVEISPETGDGLLFRNVFRNAPVAIAWCTSAGLVASANPAFERSLGIDLRGGSAVPLSDCIQPKDREETDGWFREMIARSRESFQIENQLLNQNAQNQSAQEMGGARGSGSWVRWTVWRAASLAEDSVCGVPMVEDTTANHDGVQRVREAGRLEALGRLASGIAHDFNNLLTGVSLYSDLLLAGLESRSCLHKCAPEIRDASIHASGLMRQLLAVARSHSEAPHLLSLNGIAEGMRELLLRLIDENIELVCQFDPNLGTVRMDSTQALQILLNLVLNARDALPEGGRITLETRNWGLQIVTGSAVEKTAPVELPCALFVVSNNGQGMDSQTQQHVFEAFFSTKPPGEGTGLGLSTVDEIVTNNGGLIHLESERRKGTRVTVLLPLPVPPIPLPLISPAEISPAELPNVSSGDSKHQTSKRHYFLQKRNLRHDVSRIECDYQRATNSTR
jgi:two-component system, cell cycle sensor histidine kinase and response regulator CckA